MNRRIEPSTSKASRASRSASVAKAEIFVFRDDALRSVPGRRLQHLRNYKTDETDYVNACYGGAVWQNRVT